MISLKTCYRQDTQEAKLRIADVMATLGEIGLESGMQYCSSYLNVFGICVCIILVDMFEQAIKDFSASLEIKESLLSSHDRGLAEM